MKKTTIFYNLAVVLLIALAALLFFSKLPIPGNYKALTVLSGSMEPAIKMGSVVIIVPAKDYKIGDIITFGEISAQKKPTTHRIYDIKIVDGESVYITKGDANNSPDGQDVMQGEIIGKVLFSIPYLGYALNFIKEPAGFSMIIIFPAVLIILGELQKIWREIIQKKKKIKAAEDAGQKEKNSNV